MAKKVKFEEEKDDIPAWFMTYSDVITLLMTFFILLLTFSTTEPERFEKVRSSTFAAGGATGVVGKKIEGPEQDSWVNRVRPSAARIAMRGAEMPPITREPAKESFGKGLKSLDPEHDRHNEMTSHFFDVELNRVFNSKGELTSQGKQIAATLAVQLRDLPFQAAFQYTDSANSAKIVDMMTYMFKQQGTRPGQVSISLVKNPTLTPNHLRIRIKRFMSSQR
jgi:flagellar motor protein MotB